MSYQGAGRGREAFETLPKEYLKAEFHGASPLLPYGPAWPGGFQVGAGALLLFLGAFAGFLALALLGGFLGLLAAAGVMTLALVGLGVLLWSGLDRYGRPTGTAERTMGRHR